jgi:two-component system, OmpR family, copper resistance phosphate regulon response regulator CusR
MSTSQRILIVEDEIKIAKAVSEGLKSEGYLTSISTTGEEALFLLSRERFDLIILDVMLPGRSGLEVAKLLRSTRDSIPILMLTARDSVEDRVAGFNHGTDDYLIKPFAFAELLVRVKALLRRSHGETTVRLVYNDLEMNLLTRDVHRSKKKLDLTLKEFEVLEYLLRHRNEVVSREMLARDVWQETSRAVPLDNVIDVHMTRLRKKVDENSIQPLIHTVRGVGFTLKQIEEK